MLTAERVAFGAADGSEDVADEHCLGESFPCDLAVLYRLQGRPDPGWTPANAVSISEWCVELLLPVPLPRGELLALRASGQNHWHHA